MTNAPESNLEATAGQSCADCETIEAEISAFASPAAKRNWKRIERLRRQIQAEIAPKVQAIRDAREAVFRGMDERQIQAQAEALAESVPSPA